MLMGGKEKGRRRSLSRMEGAGHRLESSPALLIEQSNHILASLGKAQAADPLFKFLPPLGVNASQSHLSLSSYLPRCAPEHIDNHCLNLMLMQMVQYLIVSRRLP
jgi:hypothetical protein